MRTSIQTLLIFLLAHTCLSACTNGNETTEKIPIPAAVDMGLHSGTLWAAANVGGTRPEDFGNYYAWGEVKTKESYSWQNYEHGTELALTKYCTQKDCGRQGFQDNLKELQPEDDIVTVAYGEGWCIPTKEDWRELYNNCTWQWTTKGDAYGQLATSNINGQSLFFPASGYIENRTQVSLNENGYYWASTLDDKSSPVAVEFMVTKNMTHLNAYARFFGQSVRGVKKKQ